MPSIPESGNNTVVDSKSRPAALKIPEPPKYTDVTRTSSASFKPPMSKDPVIKKKAEVQPADSSWFGPLSYIKTMFTGKASAESAQVSTNTEKNKKLPRTKNASNVRDTLNAKDTFEDVSLRKEEPQHPALCNGPTATAGAKTDISPRFSFTADEATGRRTKEKNTVKKIEPEEVVDPNAPKYNALRYVENKSTYLHTPDKKGTTSFRITTSSKVKSKPAPAVMSPAIGNSAKRMRRSPVLSRQSSTSPKKIPQSDSNTANNFPTRLRSKSTPDHSSIKPRPVSDTTYPKSLSLKPTSHKIVPLSQNDVNENRAKVAFVKTASKFSGPNKPTILGNKPVVRHSSKKNPSRSSKSSLQIGITPSPDSLILTRSSSMGDNRVVNKNSQDIVSAKPERGNNNNIPKSNLHRHTKFDKTPSKDEPSIMKHTNLERKAIERKVPPPAESPSFTEPSMIDSKKPSTRIHSKGSDALTKFVNAQKRAKDKLKSKMEASGENKLEPHQMVLPATHRSSPLFNPTSVGVANSGNSPKPNGLLRKGKPGTVRDISSTIAESPVRRPSPPGATCLTTYNNVDKKDTKDKEVEKIKPTIETDQKAIMFPTFIDHTRGTSIDEIEQSRVSPFGVYPLNASNTPGSSAIDECEMTLNETIAKDAITLSYMQQEESDHIEATYAFQSDHNESTEENIYHTSNEYHDVSNSASTPGNYDLQFYEVDNFEDECDIEQDTCNSALPKNAVMNGKSCMVPSSLVSETDDSALYASSNDPSERVKRFTNKTSEFLPFQKHPDNESIKFFAEQVPTATASTSLRKYNVRTVEPISISKEIRRDRPKSTDSLGRRSPSSVDRARAQSPKRPHLNQDTITHVVKNTSPVLTSSKPTNRLHPSPFLKSPNRPTAKNSGSNYLESIKHPAVPTVLEPTIIHENKAVPIPHGSPKISSYKNSPDITLSSIASSVGDALDSLSEKFKQTFPSVLKVTKSPVKPSPIETRDCSPAKPLTKPTQQIIDKPFSATATYISTMFEDKNGSPLFGSKKAEKEIDTVDSKTHVAVKQETSPQTTVIPSQAKVKPLVQKDSPEVKATEANNSEKQKNTPDLTKTDVKQSTPKKQKIQLSDSPSKPVTTEPRTVVPSEVKDSKTIAESIKQSIENTKNLLSAVFSPPKKALLPELPKQTEKKPALTESGSEPKVIPKEFKKDNTNVKPKIEKETKVIPNELSKDNTNVKPKIEKETKEIPKELSKDNAKVKLKLDNETKVDPKISKDKTKVKPKSEIETKVIPKELNKENTKVKPEIDVKDIVRTQKTTEQKKSSAKNPMLKKSIDSDPARWPTFTKPGFAKVGGTPQEEAKQTPKPDSLPPNTSPPTGPSPLSITAHSGQPKANQKKPGPPTTNVESSKETPQSPTVKNAQKHKKTTNSGDEDNSLRYQNEFNIFE